VDRNKSCAARRPGRGSGSRAPAPARQPAAQPPRRRVPRRAAAPLRRICETAAGPRVNSPRTRCLGRPRGVEPAPRGPAAARPGK
jgi:hypothetical protein